MDTAKWQQDVRMSPENHNTDFTILNLSSTNQDTWDCFAQGQDIMGPRLEQ